MAVDDVTTANVCCCVTKRQLMGLFLLSAGIVLILFLWEGHQGFDLWDEGFLWYGAQRTLLGEVPIRDFMAYDPGRYYWSAAFMALWGDNGILALRAAAAVFQTLGVFIGLVLLLRTSSKQRWLFWGFSAITLVVWMFPLYKSFDVVVSIALLAALAYLVERPSNRRYFVLGICIGLIAVFGRNHGIYAVFASLAAIAYCEIRTRSASRIWRAITVWSVGVLLGYLPVLCMSVAIPGFASAMWESVRLLFEAKATNLPLPIPWPWTLAYEQSLLTDIVRGWLLGVFFIVILLFGVLAVAYVIRQKIKQRAVSPVLVAAAFLGLPYAHYTYSRADTLHLAMGIIPFLMGSLALVANQRAMIKWPLLWLLCGASLMIMAPLHPGWVCYTSRLCIDADVAGSKLKTHPNVPVELGMLKKITDTYAANNNSFLVTPFWPGAYAVMGQKSPIWENYALIPRAASFQLAEIQRLKIVNLGFALIIDVALDGREELRFSNTHPLINRYIQDNYQLLPGVTPDPAYQLYVKKQDSR